MYIAKLNGDPKRVKKTFSMILERVLNGMVEGEKMESHKKGFLKLKYFSPLKILTFPLFEETLRAFFLSFFSPSLFHFAPSLEYWGVLIILEEKITSSKIYF
jgi:hypothetical protein